MACFLNMPCSTDVQRFWGKPLPQLDNDYKFAATRHLHIQAGGVLEKAALQIEILVCHVAQGPHTKYIGRSQYPRIENVSAMTKHNVDDKFTCPAANFWGVLGHMLEKLMSVRSFASSSGTIYNCTSIDSPSESRRRLCAIRAAHCESLSVSQSASALRADGVFTQTFLCTKLQSIPNVSIPMVLLALKIS